MSKTAVILSSDERHAHTQHANIRGEGEAKNFGEEAENFGEEAENFREEAENFREEAENFREEAGKFRGQVPPPPSP